MDGPSTSNSFTNSYKWTRGRGKDRSRGIKKDRYKTHEKNSNPNIRGRPAHLRGKEIGLYYRDLNKQRREKLEERPIATILLSERRKNDINKILAGLQENNPRVNVDNVNYDHVEDSDFKRDFMRIRNGDINDKLTDIFDIVEMPRSDEVYYHSLKEKESDPKYLQMLKQRERLPAYEKRDVILKTVSENQIVLISGETGCGKTTQVGQFILDDYIERKQGSTCKIICTQPRRISAISVAERVAEERAEKLGTSVGFQIRLEKQLPRDKASILFCTTGVVLKWMEDNPSLQTISHLIIDEIHERDIVSDFLLALLKRVLIVRKDLKVILMSATLNSEQFSKYYNNCPHLNIPGFTFPVEEYYLEDAIYRTNFDYEAHEKSWKSNSRVAQIKRNRFEREYFDMIDPYVRQLENEKKYNRHVWIQLRNPSCQDLNIDLIFELLVDICKKETREGSILIFLPGFANISTTNRKIVESGLFPKNKYTVIPLHSQMPTVHQKTIFQPAPSGMRKIILSTNIAETSITIDDVVFVIDSGKMKLSNFDVGKNTQTLNIQPVSLANASQRKGRAGRVRPGVCYHLFTIAQKMIMDQYQLPEILRTRLEGVILTAKMLQLGKIAPFFSELLNPPEEDAITLSLDLLKRLNALDFEEKLTPLGFHLAKLPLGPQIGKMILMGAIFSCLDPILSVASSLDYKDPFLIPLGKEKESDQKRFELSRGWKSDHLLIHQTLELFQHSQNPHNFCDKNFLSYHILKQLQDLKKQYMEYLYEMKFVANLNPKDDQCNINSDNLSLVKAIICAGLYPNVCMLKNPGKKKLLIYDQKGRMEFHPKSVINKHTNFESRLFVYFLKIQSSSTYIHDATMVYPLPVVFFGDNFKIGRDGEGNNTISITNLKFKCSESTSEIIRRLRNKLNWFLEYKISHPGVVNWNENNDNIQLLRAIMELITSEDSGNFDSDAFEDTF